MKKTLEFTLLLALMMASFSAYSLSLDELLLGFSAHKSFEIKFKEEKIDPFFEIPIVSRGVVTFKAPDYVRKTIHKPSMQFFELDGDYITISIKDNKKQKFAVSEQPEVAAFFESFRSILAGDKATLEKHYKVSVSGALNDWAISLKPLNERLSYRIRSIVFSGQADQLLLIETVMGNNEISNLILDKNKRNEQ